MIRAKTVPALGAAAIAALVTACGGSGGFNETIGLEQPPPDEFLVVARRPIEVPPDLGALPRPQPGAPSRVEPDPAAEARAALVGGPTASPTGPTATAGERALVAATGDADPDVRTALVEDAGPEPERRFGLDNFLGVEIDQTPGADDGALDAVAESDRLAGEGVAAPAVPPELRPEATAPQGDDPFVQRGTSDAF